MFSAFVVADKMLSILSSTPSAVSVKALTTAAGRICTAMSKFSLKFNVTDLPSVATNALCGLGAAVSVARVTTTV